MNGRTKKVLMFIFPIALAIAVFIVLGAGKRITFCDEIYTYTIVNSDKLINQYDINKWMDGQQLRNALMHDGGDSFGRMLRLVRYDMVHPPVYYALVYISSCIFSGRFSLWAGLLVNLGALIVSTLCVWLLFKRLFEKDWIASFASAVFILNQSTLSNAMLIRMYMLYTMFVLLFLIANVILHDEKAASSDNRVFAVAKYFFLGAVTVGGFLTQYYFAIIAILFFVAELIRSIRIKKIKHALWYLVTMTGAVFCSAILWRFFLDGILNNTHAGAIKENAVGFFDNLKKLFLGYMMVMNSVFQRAGGLFSVLVPIIILMFWAFGRKCKEDREKIRWSVVCFAVSVIYAGIVRALTPEYLTSTRYYYAVDAMLIIALLIAVFGLLKLFLSVKSINSTLKKAVYICTLAIIFLGNLLLVNSLNGIDYYGDTKVYDESRAELEKYSDIPWIVGGSDSWLLDTCITDFIITDRIIRLENTQPAPDNLFDGIDEFVFSEYNESADDALTLRNLYHFIVQTDKNIECKMITKSKDLTYYYCKASERAPEDIGAVREFINENQDCPWFIINNDIKWYHKEHLMDEDAPIIEVFLDKETEYVTDGSFAGYDRAVIAVSILDLDETPEDIGVYYMIGSTGTFFGAKYIGTTKGVLLYLCEPR